MPYPFKSIKNNVWLAKVVLLCSICFKVKYFFIFRCLFVVKFVKYFPLTVKVFIKAVKCFTLNNLVNNFLETQSGFPLSHLVNRSSVWYMVENTAQMTGADFLVAGDSPIASGVFACNNFYLYYITKV